MKELKIPTLNLIEKIPEQFETHPIRSFFISVIALIFLIIIMNYLIKICKLFEAYKIRKSQEEANAHVRALFNQ